MCFRRVTSPSDLTESLTASARVWVRRASRQRLARGRRAHPAHGACRTNFVAGTRAIALSRRRNRTRTSATATKRNLVDDTALAADQ